MKTFWKIIETIIAIPFAIVGSILFGLLALLAGPITFIGMVVTDIWELY